MLAFHRIDGYVSTHRAGDECYAHCAHTTVLNTKKWEMYASREMDRLD